MNGSDELKNRLKIIYGVVKLHNFVILIFVFIIVYMANITYKQGKRIKELEIISSKNEKLIEKSLEIDIFLLQLYDGVKDQINKDKKDIEL